MSLGEAARDRGTGVVLLFDELHYLSSIQMEALIAAIRRPRGAARGRTAATLGMRWPVERTDSWLSNFGQLRRNTDRRPHHRLAQLALAIALLICIKLIDRRNRWSPPIR